VSEKPLVVVESPTKIRTIQKYLGKDYKVVATVGHIKDLPPKEIGIDLEDNFKPLYRTIPGKQKVIGALKSAAGNARESIWPPTRTAKVRPSPGTPPRCSKKRTGAFTGCLFHELTRNAILNAMAHPEPLNKDKYEAQQTRRILDRLVGYQVSPLLWKKVKGSLSAGRVQSVAVRIICERERAIQQFVPEEYWSITARLEGHTPPPFEAKLVKKNGEKVAIGNEGRGRGHRRRNCAARSYKVAAVVKKTVRKNPQPPFIPANFSRKPFANCVFRPRRPCSSPSSSMKGIDLGPGEPVGLITYMRTDSTRIAAEAAHEALDWVRQTHGNAYALDKPRFFQNRKKVQDAHEAIRPTAVFNTPEKMAAYLSKDQLSLYQLIWRRFVASQMQPALIDQNTVSIQAGPYTLTVTGSTLKFPGFMRVYQTVDEEAESSRKEQPLPPLAEGDRLTLQEIVPKQHFTQPPPRFSEASLVKELEENGIGRPSTYAAILSTIRDKGYVELIKRLFSPERTGLYRQRSAGGQLPRDLRCGIYGHHGRQPGSRGNLRDGGFERSQPLLRTVPGKTVGGRGNRMLSVKGVGIPTELTCPQCQQEQTAHQIWQKRAFSGLQRLSGVQLLPGLCATRAETSSRWSPTTKPPRTRTVPKCGKPMVVKRGKYGEFLACSGFPQCNHTESVNGGTNGKSIGVKLPRSGLQRRDPGKAVQKRKNLLRLRPLSRSALSPPGTNRWRKRVLCAAPLTWWKKAASAKEPI
jgi:DNA topoisomerase I